MSVVNWDTQQARNQIPNYAHPVIRRGRLLDSLSEAMFSPPDSPTTVAMLIAPVGTGKTMLLSDWAAAVSVQPNPPTIAWLTVEERDNDLDTVRSAVRATLESTGNPAVSDAVRDLPPINDENYPFAMAQALEAVGEPVWLILDDAHLLHEPTVLEALGNFLRWAPPSLRTILAGRFEPPLAVHRMRLEGRVCDLSHRDLAFTEEEAAILFAEHGVRLDGLDLTKILGRTEGWAAGLRLAAISLARHPDPTAMITDFSGDSRVVADYLVNEVLDGLTEHEREFVVETSVPDAFTVELAEALTGNQGSRDVLDTLEHSNFLVERVCGSPGWYRYHPLLREYLRAEVGRLGRDAVGDLERVAAGWFARSGDHEHALEHALQAGDDDALLTLLQECGLRLVLAGNWATVISVLDRVSPTVRADPSTRLLRVAAELARGNTAAASSTLSALDRASDQDDAEMPAELEMLGDGLRLQVAVQTGGIENALKTLQSDPVGEAGDPELDSFALLQEGIAELYLGRLVPAGLHLEDALATARAAELPAVVLEALTGLAAVAAYRCRLDDMIARASEATDHGRVHDLTGHRHCQLAQLFGALGHYLRVEDEAAAQLASLCVPHLAACESPAMGRASVLLGAILEFESTDDRHAAARVIRDHCAPGRNRPLPPGTTALLATSAQRAFLQVGEPVWAAQVAELTTAELGHGGEVAVLQATMSLHHRRLDAARRELAPVLSGELECLSDVTLIRAWLMAATIADARDDSITARSALVEAITIAEPEAILRPFRDGGEPLRDLLDRHRGRFGVYDKFAERARSVIPQSAQGATDLLTPREMELLVELPSWHTAEQIAADLFVSVNTVKTHLRGIYRKLDVRTRRDAITEARARGLL
ncbi:LuxR C-terminal-related transcriptional regulator [Rhodococcus maanshanensis]|uniref:LuxR C-terminal-related transcriptional regulator n=1 Tax=Rhodococcus maanshanensis TaxID=183556 RepID=UPI0022B2DBFA|nr:LuxR C-terminal-related transcriptional regulator [Rhodococcus maanshanensis]MCZ4557531.1 LuxR C-terminal-related transcriptional regulator [Rhodococcus maanshanensis]